ncbi:MAG: hypothetical protein Q4C64_04035 [Erysipelotrichia bacterium]|nr:hypothetical protein [Erysipelotrichia bacterium]
MKYISLNMILILGCLYHIFSKRIAVDVNPFISSMVTYFTALSMNVLLFLLFGKGKWVEEFSKVNKYSLLLGLAIGLYDLGYLLAYRNGWKPEKLQPFTSIGIIILITLVSVIVERHKLTMVNVIGIILLSCGIILVLK